MTEYSMDSPVFKHSRKQKKASGHSKVKPVKPFHVRHVKHDREMNVFDVLFALCLFSGLPVSLTLTKSKPRKLDRWIPIWCLVATLFRTLIIIVFCAFCYLFLPSPAIRFTHYAYSICGYVLHMHCIPNTRKMLAAVRKIVLLMETLETDLISKKNALYFHLVLVIIAITGITGMHGFFFLYQEFDDNVVKMSKHLSFTDLNAYQFNFIRFAAFTAVAAYNIGSVTLYLVLLICVYSYLNIGELYSLYADKLKHDFQEGVPTQTSISPRIILFKRIAVCLKELDNAMNGCVFLVYATAISSFFNTVSCILSDNPSFRTLVVLVYIGWTSVCGMSCFLALTFSGSRVTDKHSALKADLVKLSSTMIGKSPDIRTILTFSLLFENIKTSKNFVTGLGLFHIRRNFILTVSGTMVTYAVLIHQMGAGATSY